MIYLPLLVGIGIIIAKVIYRMRKKKAIAPRWLNRFLTICATVCLISSLIPILFTAWFFSSMSMSASKVFQRYIADPIPTTVRIVYGKGVSWQGYSAQVVFTTDKKTFSELFSDYQILPFECYYPTVNRCCDTEIYYDNKLFKEDLSKVSGLQCFYKEGDVKRGQNSVVYWDKDNNKIFFRSSGG